MKLQDYEKENLKSLRKNLGECAVLLKKDGYFPVEKPCEIALYGNGARHTVFGGTGSSEVNGRFCFDIYTGLQKSGFTITTDSWLDAYDTIRVSAVKTYYKDIFDKAWSEHINLVVAGMGAIMREPEYSLPIGKGDTCIYVLSRSSGEGGDRLPLKGDILLTSTEIENILECNKNYKRFMLVLNTAGVVDLSPVSEVKNILLLSQLGSLTGLALADILLGKQNPGGHLTATWSAYSDYLNESFGDRDDTLYTEGIFVGYRYFETAGIKPIFPFGYGISYTDFKESGADIKIDGTAVDVTMMVTNIGAYSGKHVVQVYATSPMGRLAKPVKSLAGWAKTKELRPEEKEALTVHFDMSGLAVFDSADSTYVLEAGDYILYVGADVETARAEAVIRLPGKKVLKTVRRAYDAPEFRDLNLDRRDVDIKGLPVYEMTAEFGCNHVDYNLNRNINPLVKTMSDERLARALMGDYGLAGQASAIIGNAAASVAGAAGETARHLKDYGLDPLIMADGPAGLRLSKEYFKDQRGFHPTRATIPETIMDLLPGWGQRVVNRISSLHSPGAEHVFQYCTFLPVPTAVAQSFNTDFAKMTGDIVGTEMERFGVNIWLAPALNIQRSIRCGRNFEYYSEDPLISGRMAAAVTKGVQSHGKCGVVLKHFAANNQETNRYFNNSQVSERALREIYLKGFEIAIKEAEPAAVMASYNLLNGTHTAQSRQLIRDILRCEFGFTGIVMTDWIVPMADACRGLSRHPGADAAKTIAAGTNLLMPGGPKYYHDILRYIKRCEANRKNAQSLVTETFNTIKKF